MDRAVALPAGGSNTSIERRVLSSVLERRGARMSLRIVVSLVVVALTASWALAQSHSGNPKNGERFSNNTVLAVTERPVMGWDLRSRS